MSPEAMSAGDPITPIPHRIRSVRQELRDTFTLRLESADGAPGPPFAPGQFNMLYVFGVGEVPVSLSGDPASTRPLVHTVRAVGPVTEAMKRLGKGDMVGVRGPYGSAWPVQDMEGGDVLFVAGGIGLAPLRPAIYHVLANREQYGNVCICYGARTPEDILFGKELSTWRGHFDLAVDVIVDRAGRGWAGKVGMVTQLLDRGGFDPLETVAMTCGPEIMMRYVVKSLNQQGVGNDRIYVSMERSMKCATGICGHCQLGGFFVCRDGPVFRYDRLEHVVGVWEL